MGIEESFVRGMNARHSVYLEHGRVRWWRKYFGKALPICCVSVVCYGRNGPCNRNKIKANLEEKWHKKIPARTLAGFVQICFAYKKDVPTPSQLSPQKFPQVVAPHRRQLRQVDYRALTRALAWIKSSSYNTDSGAPCQQATCAAVTTEEAHTLHLSCLYTRRDAFTQTGARNATKGRAPRTKKSHLRTTLPP